MHTVLNELSAILFKDSALFCMKQVKIDQEFDQLQARKNPQQQTEHAQFTIKLFAQCHCNGLVALTVFVVKSRGHASISCTPKAGGRVPPL